MALILKQIFTTGSDEIAQNYIIESWHVSQSVDALTGQEAYDITISGSLNLTGSTLTGSTANITSITGSLLGTASWANNALTASFVQNAQTASFVLNAVSASFSSTASFVLLAQSSSISSQTLIVSGVSYPSGSVKVPGSLFNFIAGADKTGTSVPPTASIQITELTGKTLGQTAFVTATVSGSTPASTAVGIVGLIGNILTFETQNASTDFHYIIMYI